MKITEALFAEHLVFHHMFDQIEATVPEMKTLAEVQAVAAMMETLLKTHAGTEDDLFLGPLEHCFEQIGQREAFLHEHQEMDGALERVRKATQLEDARKMLLAAVSYSRRHFDKEERIIFPMAERILKKSTLVDLGQVWMDQRARVAVN
jgi:hemerythrin-like domain-containing protein